MFCSRPIQNGLDFNLHLVHRINVALYGTGEPSDCTVLENVWRNKNIFKQKETPFMEYKKRVVDSNIYAFMSGGTVSIKIVFPRGVYSTNSN